MLPVPVKTRDYAASAAPASITIIAQSFVLLGCRGSISQWLLQELTEYFQAAAADPVSSIQAPVDTVEQQAEHCQEGKEAGRRNKHGGKNSEVRFIRWESAKQGNVKYVNIRDRENEEKEKPNRVRKGREQIADHNREMEK